MPRSVYNMNRRLMVSHPSTARGILRRKYDMTDIQCRHVVFGQNGDAGQTPR